MPVSLIRKIGLRIFARDPHRDGVAENTCLQNQENNRRPDDGPPDIEQLWQDFNRRVNRFFGGDGDGPGRGAGITVMLVVVIVAVLWLFSGLFIVQEGQTGVVMMLGKFDRTAQAGLNWHWPYPIQSHEIIDMSEDRTVEVGYRGDVKNTQANESLMLTSDDDLVDVQAAVRYRISNAADWIFSDSDPEETVRQVAVSSIRNAIGKENAESTLYGDHKRVTAEIQQSIQQTLDRYRTGVQVSEVTLQSVQPPAQVRVEFEDTAKAEQDRQRQKSEGQAYADDLLPRAQASVARLIEDAQAYRAKTVEEAEGQAARFRQVLAEYRKAPGVTRDRMYLETMQQILASTTKVVTDGKGGGNAIYLPLDKLIQQQTQTPEAPAPAKPAAPPAAAPSSPAPAQETVQTVESPHPKSDSRSRDDADSRERETR